MSFYRIWAIARKEFIQILRDVRSLIMAFLFPIVLIFLFSYAITLDIKQRKKEGREEEKKEEGRERRGRFTNSRYFVEKARPTSAKELQSLIDYGHVKVGIVIPPDFADRLNRGGASIQTITDGSDANTSQSTLAYTSLIVSEYNLGRLRNSLGARMATMPMQANVRFWYNPDLDSQNFLVPGLISLIMTILGSLLTSLTISREWERGTMELLISTPLKPVELAVGKLLPYYLIGMVDLFLAAYIGIVVFGVPFTGSLWVLALFSTLFLMAALSIGYLISVMLKSQQAAYQVSMLTSFLPGFLLSGFLFPISSMPFVIQAISLVVPGRYFISALRGLFLKGSTLQQLLPEALALFLFGSVFALLAIIKFRKKIQ
ncbi:MAG: ABC transporter permease [Candidatus Zixiibacteriota bacterium]|nr:MAG: ABC transporter permease [candidate division Zixibacteria bacterium]